jgi:prepilin-type N-terminal cleavage/methylation domain-containing protein/prepilin-type processing-associated H-X9-DG protein
MATKFRKNAFTLIELLVVISIIALLVSILLPALNGAREQAKIAVCSVQLKQMGLAVYQYGSDNKDAIPTYNVESSTMFFINQGKQNTGDDISYYELGSGRQHPGPNRAGFLCLGGYIPNDANITFCPGFRNPGGIGYATGGPLWSHNSKDANSHGDVKHWNYVGVNADNAITNPGGIPMRMTPEDEAKIGWINERTGYVWRYIEDPDLGAIKTITRGKNRILTADWWEAPTSQSIWYRTHIKQLSHVAANAATARLNGWYLDGHVEGRQVDRATYFVEGGWDDGFFRSEPPVKWAHIFEDVKYVY